MPADPSIRFQAQVFKVQTLIDGGLRLTLDLGQVEPAVIVALIDARQPGVMLECAAVVIDEDALYKQRKNRHGKTPIQAG